ncbi:Kinesin-like protein KIN-7D [Durusdinium trenchii]|uniref:Mitochondrial (Mitochondria-targeted kinesin-related protein 2) n=1 Tax=Durusdinium trenchii TaxID=1381693 RepID=A0ABP0NZL2_9DINO
MEEVPDCHISVAVRLRPTQGPVAWESSQKFLVDRSGERWHFDQVFGPRASTWDLYETSVQHVIDAFCDGATCTIFACGPRASGKTFTMQGGDGPGLVQLAATHIWERAPQTAAHLRDDAG